MPGVGLPPLGGEPDVQVFQNDVRLGTWKVVHWYEEVGGGVGVAEGKRPSTYVENYFVYMIFLHSNFFSWSYNSIECYHISYVLWCIYSPSLIEQVIIALATDLNWVSFRLYNNIIIIVMLKLTFVILSATTEISCVWEIMTCKVVCTRKRGCYTKEEHIFLKFNSQKNTYIPFQGQLITYCNYHKVD